jgi:hypothetical protein
VHQKYCTVGPVRRQPGFRRPRYRLLRSHPYGDRIPNLGDLRPGVWLSGRDEDLVSRSSVSQRTLACGRSQSAVGTLIRTYEQLSRGFSYFEPLKINETKWPNYQIKFVKPPDYFKLGRAEMIRGDISCA